MRLVTRSDFDGLVCAVLLRQVENIHAIQFVHPKDLQDGRFEVTPDDILANVPYVRGCGLWFDHHVTEVDRVTQRYTYAGDCRIAPSAARVVFDYYGGRSRFENISDIDRLMYEVDKADSARFSKEEILFPSGWPLLSFLMDGRTGLGRYKDYRISNYQLMQNLIDACKGMDIDQILQMPDVQERVQRYFAQDALVKKMIADHSYVEGNVIVTDLRDVDPIHCGNRFLVYALYPEQNTSIWIVNGLRSQNCVFACGHSILNRASRTHIGSLMRRFLGGGHEAAGTCQVPYAQVNETLSAMLDTMYTDETQQFAKAA